MEDLLIAVVNAASVPSDAVSREMRGTDLSEIVMQRRENRYETLKYPDMQKALLTEDEVFESAGKHPENMHYSLMTLEQMVGFTEAGEGNKQEFITDFIDSEMSMAPFFVLTNLDGRLGASVLANHDALQEVRKCLGDDLIILPSSIHEVLVMKKSDAPTESQLRELITSVNETEVSPAERLSNYPLVFDGMGLSTYHGMERTETQEHRAEKERVLA